MKIGITGVISSGKSTILKLIKDLGYKVIDCDIIVNELYQKKEIIELLDKEFNCVRNNKIDKSILSKIIFNDLNSRIKLNSLIHPLIRDYIKNINDDLIFIEIPLLFEAKMEDLVDKIILVYLNNEECVNRLMKRNNLTKIEALNKVNSQMSCDKKASLSDFIIDNSKDLESSKNQLKDILKKLGV